MTRRILAIDLVKKRTGWAFGWWLHRLWIEKIPRIALYPRGWQVCWLGQREEDNLPAVFIRKHITKFHWLEFGRRSRCILIPPAGRCRGSFIPLARRK